MTQRYRLPAAVSASFAAALALSACVGESRPDAGSTDAADSPTPVETAPSPSPSTPPPATVLPSRCDDIYSDALRATLEQQAPPLNHPGVTLPSTAHASLQDLLDAVPTLRCSWGGPSEMGLATNVSIVDTADAVAVRDTLDRAGFDCRLDEGATICRVEERHASADEIPFARGETHALRGDVWIATSWLNLPLEGYTEDILATLSE